MSGRVNHRGWIVLESISSFDGMFCVDFFQDPGGGFGYEHFRADPEDGGRWQAVGGFGSVRFDNASEAAADALTSVVWLEGDGQANQAWENWCQRLNDD